jgi:hypothetical protein
LNVRGNITATGTVSGSNISCGIPLKDEIYSAILQEFDPATSDNFRKKASELRIVLWALLIRRPVPIGASSINRRRVIQLE